MPTYNKTLSVRNGLDVANTIVLDSGRNLSNIVAIDASNINVDTLNVETLAITANVEPNLNVSYDLGSPTKRYKNLYLSNNALHLGEAVVSANGPVLVVSGVEIDGSGNLVAAFDSYNQANAAYDQANAAYGQANAAYSEANLKLNLTGGSLSGSLNINGDLSVTNGNIYLSGNTTFINVSTYAVDDPLIYLAANNLINDSVDIGFVGSKNSGPSVTHTGLARDASDGTWYLFDNLADSGHVGNVIDFANSSLAILRANINANSILLTGNAVATQANLTLAHDQANTARDQANTARDTANSAYGQANGAYGQANTARDTANDAYGQANTARATANDSYAQANAAYGQANTARDQANTAYGQANAAYAEANTANTNALNAYGQANTARDTANDSYAQANTARNTANDAYGAANTANTNALNSYAQANTARDTANDSYAQANTARGTANDAYNQANSAYGQANAAYNAANNAKVTVFANNASNVTTQNVNFVNTATVTVSVTADGSNANIAFSAATQTLVDDTYTAAGNTVAAATANIANGLYAISTSAFSQANAARDQANTARDTANDAYIQANTARDTANSAYSEANLKLNVAGGTITGNLIISGNLEVLGNSTTLNVETLFVEDNEIILNSNVTGSPVLDAYVTINRGTSNNASIKWDENTDQWKWNDGDNNYFAFDSALDAYSQANAAYGQANSAYGQANTARDTANDAYGQANTARGTANDSYGQANAAYGQANTARNTANDSYGQANAAYSQANAAYNAANNAQVTVYQNSASNITTQRLNFVNTATITVSVTPDGSNANIEFTAVGGAAYDQANAAYGQANAAYGQANTARDTGNSAYAQANGAYGQANGAYNQANVAANTVRVYANSASELSNKFLNFINTASIQVGVTDNGDGNANISFITTGAAVADAYAQANAAYSAANSAANTVRISQNSNSSLSAKQINFVNTATVTINVSSGVDGNANISFTAVGGGGGGGLAGNAAVKDVFSGNGTVDTFALSVTPTSNSYTLVFVDRVYQETTDYRLNGSQLEFLTGPPPANSVIEAFTYFGTTLPSIILSDNFTGTGSCTQFALSQTCAADRTLVYLNGVSQRPTSDFQVSGATLTFTTAPAVNTNIEVRTIGISATANANIPVTFMTDTFTANGLANEYTLSQAGTTNTTFVFLNGIAQKPTVDYYVANGVLTFTSTPANGLSIEARTAGAFTLVDIDQSRVDSDKFIGNGACTQYALSAVTSTAKAFVFLDGVAQQPYTDYVLNGSQLIFAEPPESNSQIEVRTLSEFKYITDYTLVAYDRANGAYVQANGAYAQANGAYAQANAAYAHANIVYAQANAAYNDANTRVLKSGDTMTGNLNVAATLITQNIIPSANVTYDLGTSTRRFKDLYLSNSTIFLGETSISSNGNVLQLGETTLDPTGAFKISAGSNTQRPASPTSGMIRFNTTMGEPEWYDGGNTQWYTFASGRPGPPIVLEYMIIAGGGGGGNDMGGGGGAGGYLTGNTTIYSGNTYVITVGGGGAGAPAGTGGSRGTSGQNTTAFGVTAYGGGGGASGHSPSIIAADNGGSGGGASGQSSNRGLGVYPGSSFRSEARQGYDGANSIGAWYPGGGGGSAGAGLVNIASGGPGTLNSILGSAYYWAGGGGGGGYSNWGGNGGIGGGGGGAPRDSNPGTTGKGGTSAINNGSDATVGSLNSQTNVPGGNAGTNTGSGGGGGSHYASNNGGGSGGSGIVVVRYAATTPNPKLTGGTTSNYTANGTVYQVHMFTGTGALVYAA